MWPKTPQRRRYRQGDPARLHSRYIKATVGFEKLAEATGTQPKSLIRMFDPHGNPQARSLGRVIGCLQKRAGVKLHVMAGSGVNLVGALNQKTSIAVRHTVRSAVAVTCPRPWPKPRHRKSRSTDIGYRGAAAANAASASALRITARLAGLSGSP
jgi:hypothetical protein